MLIRDTNASDMAVLKSTGARVSYSQLGEDMIIAHYMRYRDGFYVDVGCHDPYRFSNTAIFSLYKNWSGINIDADPRAIEKFRELRPRDVSVNCGVSDVSGELEFTLFRDNAQNSFDPHRIAAASAKMEISEVRRVPVRTLKDILDEHLPRDREIDYMNIDCEGYDEKVVLGNDWTKYRPKFLSVEIHGLDLSRAFENRVFKQLAAVGYKLRSHCVCTSIFQRI